ncbi:putative selenate ABC transporter substrate-binding protein [Pelagibaculum spongiae]|uniref:Putative selenate ABC transporter substrate-binding protein n=1 Tax=Pelagibaculum spongiae TaxID=2080658 RepID=A0A2V1GWK1_9GAMM|nr:putative selenate ABC transporter substrate-binding protein [Pelagibaculum spongiae]PVZ69704.1 putative selenate ABC transporter substrate-binding protein [Pelagibaculum spongiae]
MKKLLQYTLFSILLSWFPLQVSAEVFTFTAIPDQDEQQLQKRFGKVAEYLSEQLGVEVRYIPVKSYAAAVSAFRNDQVQLAWFGGLSGVRARQLVPGSVAIAQGVEDQAFETWFIANKQTEIDASANLSEKLRGLRFTFGSKGSTSGRLMPEYYVRQQFNQAPEKVFSRVGFSGDHSRTIALVQAGAYQAGAVNFKVWQRELAEGKIDTSKVDVIWKTPAYPDYQWSVRGDIEQRWGKGFTDKLQQVLLNIKQPEILESFPRSGFIKADNSDYQPILDTAKNIGLID